MTVVGRPVLVGGCSRSGTTLLGAMMGWGEGRLTVPEADFKWELFAAGAVRGDDVDLARAGDLLRADPKFRLWGIEPPAVDRIGMPFAEFMSYLVAQHALVRGASAQVAWVDHTPANIRFVPTFNRVLPGARFVHVVRDGRAVAASVIPLDWGPNTASEAARHWALQVAAGLAAAEALGPDLVHTVRFEDLVLEPERTLKSVCEFAGLEYDDRMVERREYDLPAYTAGQHELVRRRPDPRRVDAWRGVLSPAQVRAFERLTGELLDLLGYPTVYGIRAERQRAAEHYFELAGSATRRVVLNRVRRQARWYRGGPR
jgi:Sulfotransferase family